MNLPKQVRKTERRTSQVQNRTTAVVATIIMLIVMLATILLLMPSGAPLKQSVHSVAAPYFSQNWRVFAPGILKINRKVEIRAQWRDNNNELVASGWVSISDIEEQTVGGNLTPSRIHKNAFNSSQTLLNRYNELEDAQKERVRDTFIERSDDGFQPIPVEYLLAELGEDDGNVVRYLRSDYMYMRYATLYATAGFDEDIERVQWRILRERPNDFDNRHLEEQQYAGTTTTFGWRQSNVAFSQDVLDEYKALIERTGMQHLFTKAADNAE